MNETLPSGMSAQKFLATWRNATSLVTDAVTKRLYHNWDKYMLGEHRRLSTTKLNRFAKIMEDENDWRWRVPGRPWRLSELERPQQSRVIAFDASMIRLLRFTHALSRGEACRATAEEIELLKDALGADAAYAPGLDLLRPDAPSAPIELAPGEVAMADVAFAWRRLAPNGKESTNIALGKTRVAIVGKSNEDSPVEMRLRTKSGYWLEIRRVDGRLYRPLFAHGAWAPAGLADCLKSLANGFAWDDHPGAGDAYGVPRHFDLDDVAAETFPAKESAKMEKDAESMATRCSDLVVIDGIVYRPTDPPRIGLTTIYDARGIIPSAGWSLSNISSDATRFPLDNRHWIGGPRTFYRVSYSYEPESEVLFDPSYQRLLLATVDHMMALRGEESNCRPLVEGVTPALAREEALEAIRLVEQMPEISIPADFDKIVDAVLAEVSDTDLADLMSAASYEITTTFSVNESSGSNVCAGLLRGAADCLKEPPQDDPDADEIAAVFTP